MNCGGEGELHFILKLGEKGKDNIYATNREKIRICGIYIIYDNKVFIKCGLHLPSKVLKAAMIA